MAGNCIYQGVSAPAVIGYCGLPNKATRLIDVLVLRFNRFIALLNLFFCTNYLRGANVFPRSNRHQGIALSLCLTKKEIRELTLKVHYAAQARTLSEMGIRHTLRPDGSPVVLHSILTELMNKPKRMSNQPDFSSLGQ
jgi:hypothetical protein